MGSEEAPDSFSETFGEVLRRLRRQRGKKQIEVAVELPVDHSLVSRWENGSVLPGARDVRALGGILRLSEEEQEELDYSWRRTRSSLLERDHDAPFTTADEWIESLRVSIDCVRSLRKSGQPRLAMVLCRRDAGNAFMGLRSMPWSAGHFRALAELSELLLEETKAGLDYLPGSAVRRGDLRRTLRVHDIVAAGSGHPAAKRLYIVAQEGVTYVAGNVGDAHELGLSLLNGLEDLPLEWVPEIIRACGINAGKLRDADGLRRAEAALQRLLDERVDLPHSTRAFILEGLGRGWVGVDPKSAMNTIHAAWEAREMSTDSQGSSLLRYVQLVRSQAEVELSLHSRSNREDTLSRMEKALTISNREGYDKYEMEIDSLIERMS